MRRFATIGALALVAACTVLALAPSSAVASNPTFAFPSSSSTVVGSVGFIDSTQVGYFWSAARGDKVSQTFTGPSEISRAILNVDVVANFLNSGNQVDWNLQINGTPVGSFAVHEGVTGAVTLDVSFPPIAGPSYNVTIRVTNQVPGGGGSISLAYAGSLPHSIQLFESPAANIADLQATVAGLGLPKGLTTALNAKLQDALNDLNAGDTAGACDSLQAFLNQVKAQTGKGLTSAQAQELTDAASAIRTQLGC